MSFAGFKPIVWSSNLQTSLKKSLVYGSDFVVNRDYEGEIQAGGSSVKITSISRPTVNSHTGSVTWEDLTDAQRTLVIDQEKDFAFNIKDIDKAQTANGGRLMLEATEEAAYAVADTQDQFIAGLYTGAASANALGATQCTTGAKVFTMVRQLGLKLDQANVTKMGRYCVLPAFAASMLLEDDRIIRVDASGSDEALRNGYVGQMLGFRIFMSNNAPNTAGDDYLALAGVRQAITFAEQLVEIEPVRREDYFTDGLKGLYVYGAKLVRPTAIATAEASIT